MEAQAFRQCLSAITTHFHNHEFTAIHRAAENRLSATHTPIAWKSTFLDRNHCNKPLLALPDSSSAGLARTTCPPPRRPGPLPNRDIAASAPPPLLHAHPALRALRAAAGAGAIETEAAGRPAKRPRDPPSYADSLTAGMRAPQRPPRPAPRRPPRKREPRPEPPAPRPAAVPSYRQVTACRLRPAVPRSGPARDSGPRDCHALPAGVGGLPAGTGGDAAAARPSSDSDRPVAGCLPERGPGRAAEISVSRLVG